MQGCLRDPSRRQTGCGELRVDVLLVAIHAQVFGAALATIARGAGSIGSAATDTSPATK